MSKRASCGGKVREVVGHDDAGAGPDGGGQHMPVIGIRQRQGLDQVFVAGYEAVAHRLVHQGSGPGQPLRRKLRIVLEDVAKPLVVDRVRPPGADQPCLGEPDEEVTQRGRVQDIRVVDGDGGQLHQ